ncbi:MAG: tRNA (cytidine(34)-2'-O)-methyltransferase [Sphingomonas sp.]|nr:tRNA (cytidine(34)-2'-O)-methyltransferase [Sphingomonas sp.]MBX9795711.1 tRNA (cytidine(34)-2'-O)-methyltransferase [Sphingomonas sp.]
MRLALLEPDIAGNVGTLMRLSACLGVPLDLIEPMGFPLSDRQLVRAGLDYAARAVVVRHIDWTAFATARTGRLVAVETAGAVALGDADFQPGDTLLLGAESRGLPPAIVGAADLVVRIPLVPGSRSLNVAVAAALVLSEALRQTNGWPKGG